MNPRPLGYEPSGTVQHSPVPRAPVRHGPAGRGTFRQAVSMTVPSQNRGRTPCLSPAALTALRRHVRTAPPDTIQYGHRPVRVASPRPRQRPAPSQCQHGGCHPLLAAGYRSCREADVRPCRPGDRQISPSCPSRVRYRTATVPRTGMAACLVSLLSKNGGCRPSTRWATRST